MKRAVASFLLVVASTLTGLPDLAIQAYVEEARDDSRCRRCHHYHFANRYTEPNCLRRQRSGGCKYCSGGERVYPN